jgi:hypothetical protein
MPPAHAPWRNAGTTLIDSQAGLAAAALPDGRVLALGSRISCHDEETIPITELWDPATGAWRETASLDRPRTGFVMVALADGRVLVAGGTSAHERSYSSTYLFDPRPRHESWSKAGLLGTARTGASAVLLHDGRILVMGGYYQDGPLASHEAPSEAVFVGYHPRARARSAPADIGPSPWQWPVLATAELFDPANGAWTPTGPMRAAQVGGPAATLADGRVLIVGGSAVEEGGYNPYPPELYDPRTGGFTRTGPLPAGTEAEYVDPGSLVALADGGALLVGCSGSSHGGLISRSLRFDVRTGRWSEVGDGYDETWDRGTGTVTRSGADRSGAMAAVLPNGRVLAAGGIDRAGERRPTSRAELFYPALDGFASLPPLPEARAHGRAVALADGSVMVIGHHGAEQSRECTDPERFASAIRYLPGS